MAIDPSIIFQLKQPQIENPVNALANVLQLQQAQQGNQLRGMQMQEMERGQAGENALAKLLATGGSAEDVARGLATQGYGKQSMDYTKQQQALQASKLAAEKDLLANTHKKLEIGSQLLSGANDQASYDAARAQAQSMGIDFSKLPAQFDPAFVQRTVQQGIDMKTQLEQKWKAMEYTTPKAGDVLQAQTSRANNAATVGATIRGQNLVDARTRETNAATVGKPFEVTGPEGTPVLVRQDKKGNITPVEGFGPKSGSAKLTEDQGKATGWLVQAENAFANMKAAAEKDPSSVNPGVNDYLGAAGNVMRGGTRQQYLQGASSLSESLLRAATGAGVNKDEAAQKVKELTPQIGDSAAVIKQKMDSIPLYIESLKVRAGPGAKQAAQVLQTKPGATRPNIDALLDKYK